MSPAQLEYVASQTRRRRMVTSCRFLLFILFLSLWELCSRMELIDSFIFSCPSLILSCMASMAMDGSLIYHTGVTLAETLISFFLVIGLSLTAALLLWSNRSLFEILEPFLVMLNSLPKSALAPILIVWLGNRPRTIVTAAVSVALFGAVLTLYTGFTQISKDKIRLIYSLGGKKKDVLLKVLLPASVPLIISSMKVNAGLCLVGVIIGEFLSSKAGLGYLIIYSSQVFQMTLMVTSIVILSIVSVVIYQGIAILEKRLSAKAS